MTNHRREAVSVIAPLHNAEDFVEPLINQLKTTLGAEDAALIVDDASTDATLELVRKHTNTDRRFIVIPVDTNIGVARARNLALARVSTEFVWFVDHDDTWEKDVLDKMCTAIGDADILFSRADYRIEADVPGRIVDGIDAFSTLGPGEAIRHMLKGDVHGYLWSKLFRASVLGDAPFPPLTSQSDFCGVAEAVARARTVRTVPSVYYHYLQRSGSITRTKGVNFENFRVARDVMRRAATTVGVSESEPTLVVDFDCRFYAHALAFVPLRQHSPASVRRRGFALARASLLGTNLAALLRRNRRLGAEMTLIKMGWLPYTACTSIALFAFDRIRGIRTRRRTRA